MNTLVSVTPSLFAAVLVAGCAYPNQFRNIRADSPYAVLVGEDVTLFHINVSVRRTPWFHGAVSREG